MTVRSKDIEPSPVFISPVFIVPDNDYNPSGSQEMISVGPEGASAISKAFIELFEELQ